MLESRKPNESFYQIYILQNMNSIIFVTQHLPFPPISGARRREHEILKQLSKSYKLHLFVISKVYEEDKKLMDLIDFEVQDIEIVKSNSLYKLDNLESLEIPFQIHRNRSANILDRFEEYVNSVQPSVIHFEGYFLYPLYQKEMDIPVVVADQNIEYNVVYQQFVNNKKHKLARIWQRQYHLTKSYEIDIWKKADRVVAVSSDDKYVMDKHLEIPATLISNGYDHDDHGKYYGIKDNLDGYASTLQSNNSINLLFVGNHDYPPNADALEYFFPLLHQKLQEKSDLKFNFTIVGNNTENVDEKLKNMDNADFIGRVNNLNEMYRACDIFICPLRFGGGIKTKMLEAINAEIPTITTSVGAQGMTHILKDKQPFVVVDDPDEFADTIIELASNTKLSTQLKENAKLFKENWTTWSDVASQLSDVYDDVINEWRFAKIVQKRAVV